MYSQLFNLLCDKADDVYGGRLPVHVRCLLDEFANIGLIPKFEKLIATIRSREISASIILQAQSQLKAIYKDLSLIHISEPTRQAEISYAVFCLKKKKKKTKKDTYSKNTETKKGK